MDSELQALLPDPAWSHRPWPTPRAHLLKLLQEAEQRYRSLMDISEDAILVHCDGAFVMVNDAAVQLLGATEPEQLIGRAIVDFVNITDWQVEPQVVEAPAMTDDSETRSATQRASFVKRKLLRLDGTGVEAQVAANRCQHDGRPAIQLVARALRDVAQEEVGARASFDPLTLLPTRTELRDRLVGSLARAGRNSQLVALLFIDLDNFQQVNATLGQANGDMVLRNLAQRLKQRARRSDTVARLGGDAFAIVLEGLTDESGAAVVARKMLDILSRPVLVNGQPIQVSASIGVSVYPTNAGDLDRLWSNADLALAWAREVGGDNYQFHTLELEARGRRGELRRAQTVLKSMGEPLQPPVPVSEWIAPGHDEPAADLPIDPPRSTAWSA